MTGYEPRFDRDYTYGLQGELLIGDLLQQIAAGQASIEVKRPRRADDIVYVELQQHPAGQGWKWSGLAVTTADYWVYLKPGNMILFVPVPTLKACTRTRLANHRPMTDGGTTGDNPTRGYLIPAHELFRHGDPG